MKNSMKELEEDLRVLKQELKKVNAARLALLRQIRNVNASIEEEKNAINGIESRKVIEEKIAEIIQLKQDIESIAQKFNIPVKLDEYILPKQDQLDVSSSDIYYASSSC